MTQTILALILRHVLTAAGAIAVAKGYATDDMISQIIGALSTIGGLVWSVYQKHATGALTSDSSTTKGS